MNMDLPPGVIVAYLFGFTVTIAVILAFVSIEYGKSIAGMKILIIDMGFWIFVMYALIVLFIFIVVGYALAKFIDYFSI